MWGDESQLKIVRERIKLLLKIHYADLAPVQRLASQGDLLMRQGDPATSLMLLTSGKVAVQIQLLEPRPHTLAVLEAEELLGEMGLFGTGIHSADVRVVEGPAELIEVSGDNFLKTLLFDVDLAMEMLSLVSQRCKSGNRVIGLLLDGIAAAHRGDTAQLAAIASAIRPLDHCLSLAGDRLVELGERRA
ncbi:cyclic nucleotide-binding domain-containing protein [Synechococcus sp. CS-602]|uniref:cyclic nucleotide-binding domain-containing protein n=1 Tax=Synechococcaceae TaxID=1890426 RepID=UPI0008FF454E|nr:MULTISPECIES: cyclic nucleotide-binding domain-containing protein [Synechococcaceae]MCT4365036.1 cyclic nucleotide-binding domain-containing protein [Candidatus Regnicoccus frigidus MAG-AL1]APD47888.1 cyclic nucleotide-binding protein [Synechococcus sp. SynAce01]MCT0203004.1 cyclic nucleotide-binding domain-containing protein [Synechococcus sp. CS-603]MCT0204643.1 cyclic nucleotide-binding domain-containing protein [Synechococcus sp. CS-602]MCT0245264.1 cyclic nucleotide-binding domain-cont